MKFSTFAVVLIISGAAWGNYYNEILRKKAPWLAVPQPEVVDVGEFLWQVAVIADDSFFCAGSLVTQRWVLTAAHCTSEYQVFDLAIGPNQDVRQTTRSVTRHPEYNQNLQENDLALLELPTEVPLSRTVGTVRLPTSGLSYMKIEGMDLTLTGWDSLEDKLSIWAAVSSPPLKSIRVRGAPDSDCFATYGGSFSPNEICLDTTSSPYEEGILSLVDGGSPILSLDSDGKFTQVGMLSFGPGHSTLRPPVVATKIASYLSWIETITGIPSKRDQE